MPTTTGGISSTSDRPAVASSRGAPGGSVAPTSAKVGTFRPSSRDSTSCDRQVYFPTAASGLTRAQLAVDQPQPVSGHSASRDGRPVDAASPHARAVQRALRVLLTRVRVHQVITDPQPRRRQLGPAFGQQGVMRSLSPRQGRQGLQVVGGSSRYRVTGGSQPSRDRLQLGRRRLHRVGALPGPLELAAPERFQGFHAPSGRLQRGLSGQVLGIPRRGCRIGAPALCRRAPAASALARASASSRSVTTVVLPAGFM